MAGFLLALPARIRVPARRRDDAALGYNDGHRGSGAFRAVARLTRSRS
jgi:hypothetical protein